MLDHVGVYAIQSVRANFIGFVLGLFKREEQLGLEQSKVVRFRMLCRWCGYDEEIPPESAR